MQCMSMAGVVTRSGVSSVKRYNMRCPTHTEREMSFKKRRCTSVKIEPNVPCNNVRSMLADLAIGTVDTECEGSVTKIPPIVSHD